MRNPRTNHPKPMFQLSGVHCNIGALRITYTILGFLVIIIVEWPQNPIPILIIKASILSHKQSST